MPILLANFPRLQERLQGVLPLDIPLAIGPLQRTALRPIAPGLILLGDAAGYLDALTGEGLSLAFAQALALEETVVPLLLASSRRKVLSLPDLTAYRQAYQRTVRSYYWMTHLVLWLSHHPALAEQVIGLLGARPALFQSLLSLNMGVTSLNPFRRSHQAKT